MYNHELKYKILKPINTSTEGDRLLAQSTN